MSMSKESQYARRVRERDEARAELDRLREQAGVSIQDVRVQRYAAALRDIAAVAGTASPGQIRAIVRDALGDDA